METLIILILLIYLAFNIALFIKLWKACNDIRDLADKYAPEAKERRKIEQQKKDTEALKAFIEE